MLTVEEKQELISLINNREMDPELLALELNISEEEMNEYIKEARLQKESENQSSTSTQITKKSKKKRKKSGKNPVEQDVEDIPLEEVEEYIATDYKEIIEKTKQIINDNQKRNKLVDMNKRNFLAYTYFVVGDIEKAKQELLQLIQEYQSVISYQQMIYIEKEQGNIEDAKFWAYEAMDNHPQNANVMKQLIKLDEKTEEWDEAIEIAEKLKQINPQVVEYHNLLKRLQKRKIDTQDLEK